LLSFYTAVIIEDNFLIDMNHGVAGPPTLESQQSRVFLQGKCEKAQLACN